MDTPDPKKPATAPKVVHIKRFQIALNVLIQTLVVLAIVLMANYLSFRHFRRWDFSRDQKYALSSQTKTLLRSLKKPVKAVVFLSNATDILPDTTTLLHEYEYASNQKFNMEVVDPFRNMSRAQELQNKYKFGTSESIVILDYDGRNKFVNAADMGDYEMPDQMAMMSGQTQPRLKAFKGEQAITSALLELTEGKVNKTYMLTGHGELDLKSAELGLFKDDLKKQNIQSAGLSLIDTGSVPADAQALIIDGPKYDYSELELKLLSDFWEKKGRIFIALNPFANTPQLAAWLEKRGIEPQQDRIIRTGTFLRTDEQGNPQLVNGKVVNAAFIVADSQTKITNGLSGVSKTLLGESQSLTLDKSKETTAQLKLTPLLLSGEGFWGETDLAGGDDKAFFDDKKDHRGPLNIAVAVEKGGTEDRRVKVETSRLIVVGNAQILTNNAYRASEGVTLDLTINALNWLLDREDLIGIAPKERRNTTFTLDNKQLASLAWIVAVILPGIVALFGIGVWWQRRH